MVSSTRPSINPISPRPSNGSPSSLAKVGPRAPFFTNKWGYGRPHAPSPASESFAWKIIPWRLIIGLDLFLAALLTYLPFGIPSHSSYSAYAYLILFPLLAVVLALPTFAAVAIPLSYILSPAGPGRVDDFFLLKDNTFGRRWKGRKVPILTLYEAYFAGEVDLRKDAEGKETDLLAALYERECYVRCVIEYEHVVFFFTKFIPELLRHSRAQDVEQVREHYDRGDDFYQAFLGESMIYTSAIFNDEDDTLEQAQQNKLNLVANKSAGHCRSNPHAPSLPSSPVVLTSAAAALYALLRVRSRFHGVSECFPAQSCDCARGGMTRPRSLLYILAAAVLRSTCRRATRTWTWAAAGVR